MSKKLRSLVLVCIIPLFSFATHIVGGSLTYEHLGGATYRLVLKLYRDCAPGNVAFPATVGIRITQPNGTLIQTVNIPFPGATNVQPQIDSCAVDPGICLQEAIYSTVVNNLPPNPGGYHLYYQLCCRNASVQNIVAPLSTGASWYTFIPDNNVWLTNSSPVWTTFPPVFVCQGNPLNFDNSAVDIDGDSLVYSLYTPYRDNAPTFPGNVCTFTPVTWVGGYGPTNALGGPPNSLTISNTGLLNGIPPQIGQFVVGIKCEEYRNGQKIGEILRDFQFNVVYCPPLAQPNFTTIGNCSGSTVQFVNTTSPPANTYTWNFGDPLSTQDTSTLANPPAWTYSGLGPYTVTLIVNYGTPCADTITQQVVIAFANATFTHNGPVCAGSPIQFTDGSTASINNTVTGWSWTFGDNTSSTVQNPTHIYPSGGTYTVTLYITSSAGCTDTYTQTVTIQSKPIANAGLDTIACLNNPTVPLGGTVLNATGGMWIGAGVFNPNNTTLNATYTPTPLEVSNGSATLYLITTGNGVCVADTDTIVVTFYPGPTANAGPDIYVCRDTAYVPLSGVVTVATSGSWSAINGTGTFNPNNNQLNTNYIPSPSDTAQGSVTLVLTTTGNGNCLPSYDTVVIYFTQPPIVTILASDTACSGDWIQVSGSSSTGSGSWISLGSGTFVPNNTVLSPIYIPSTADGQAGYVDLVFISTNNGGCQAQRDTFRIILIPSPTAGFSAISACPGDTVHFTDTSIPNVGSITNWNWNFGDASPNSTLQNPSHVYTAPGPFVVTLVVWSTNGCRDTIIDTVNVYYPPVVNFTYDGGCQNEPVAFTDATTVNGGIATGWTWNFGDNSPNSNAQNPTHGYVTGGTYGVTLTVISNQGCVGTVTLPVTIYPAPTAGFIADDYTAVIGQVVHFTDQSVTNIISWQWYFGDGDSSNVQNPTHTYSAGGVYLVMLVVTDSNGCRDTIYKEIIVSMPPDVPTGFSPNGDGENDILYVYGGPYKTLEFRIYNNWGELIFVSTKQSIGWDGTRNGKIQPIGVYVWTVKATTEDNLSHEISGDVTLMR